MVYETSDGQFLATLPKNYDLLVKKKISPEHLIFQAISGDKSISLRALIFNALGYGTSIIQGILQSEDILSCINALNRLGVVTKWQGKSLKVSGVGLHGLTDPGGPLDIDNSATSVRLLMAILASQSFETIMRGNKLLSNRPMSWVALPLINMGATIQYLEKSGCLPISIKGQFPLHPINVNATVSSAQEKSTILVAGMFAYGQTSYIQRCQSRDHTERIMQFLGIPITTQGSMTSVNGLAYYSAKNFRVPGDISSAAFLIAAVLMRAEKAHSVTIKNIGVNPTRTGFLKVLQQMGVTIQLKDLQIVSGEDVADITCVYDSPLRKVMISDETFVQSLIDEIPILAALACFANGISVISNCSELKDKDTNRITTTATMLRQFGAKVETSDDSITIYGNHQLHSAVVDSIFDHRIAMTASILASTLEEYSQIENCGCIAISYPTFIDDLAFIADIKVIPKS